MYALKDTNQRREVMRTLFIFTAVLGLCSMVAGCYTPAEERERIIEGGQWSVQRIVYFKDTAPNPPLCYAVVYDKFTNVPCGPVEHLISAKSTASSRE